MPSIDPLDSGFILKNHRQELLQRGIEHMDSGGTLTQYKEIMKNAQEEHGTIVWVSERLLNREFEKANSGGVVGKFMDAFGYMIGFGMIAAGIIMAIFLWNSGWISTIPFILIGMGLYGLSRQ